MSDAPELWSDPTRPPGLLVLGSVAADGDDPTAYTDAELARVIQRQIPWPSPWYPGYAAEVAVHARHAETLLPRAEAWLDQAADHPWLRAFDPARQGLLQHEGAGSPREEHFVRPSGVPPHPGWWFPDRGGLRGTTLLDPGGVPATRDLAPGADVRLWHLEVCGDARVLEIATQADWLELMERFPARRDEVRHGHPPSFAHRLPVYGVDWERAADALDGIRFRFDGFLRMGDMQLPVLDGVTVWLPDDLQDETVWLRWAFERVVDLGPLADHLRRVDEEEARALPAGEHLELWHLQRQNTARARRFRRIERAAAADPGLAAVLYDLPSELSAVQTGAPLVAFDPDAPPAPGDDDPLLPGLRESMAELDELGPFALPDHSVDLDEGEDRLYVDFAPFRHPAPGGRTIALDARRRYDVEADGTLRGVELDLVSRGVRIGGLPEPARMREVLAGLGIRILDDGTG